MGLRASFLARKLPYLGYLCNKHDVTVLLINQIRDKVGGMIYGETTTMPGGHALKHQSSVIYKVMRKEWLASAGERLGQVVKVVTTKSKVCSPYREAEIPFIFDKGFVGGCTPDMLKQELKDARKRSLQRQKDGAKPMLLDPEDTTPVVSVDDDAA